MERFGKMVSCGEAIQRWPSWHLGSGRSGNGGEGLASEAGGSEVSFALTSLAQDMNTLQRDVSF
jgi:hypothetical protein